MLRQQRQWLAYYATLLSFATTTTTTTHGFIPTSLPILSTIVEERRQDGMQTTTTRMEQTTIIRRRRRRQQQTTELWAKSDKKKKSKKEEEAAKRADVSNSAFFQSVSGFFKDESSAEPQAKNKEGGFLSNFRRKDKKEDPKSKESPNKESSLWGFFRKDSTDGETLDVLKKESAPSNLFKEARNRVKDATSGFTSSAAEAVKKEISSKDLRLQKDDDKKKPKQRRKEEKRETESLSNSVLRRVQDILPRSSSDAKESKNPKDSVNTLSVVQKFAGSVWKNNNAEKEKEEWVPVFPKTRIMPGEMVPVTVGGIDLLAIASNDGQSLYCIANSCPHLGTPLETGRLTRLPIEDKSLPSTATTTKTPFGPQDNAGLILSETDVSNILSQDGCEDCIVCPLHKTAFALQSGEVRGEWCPYPPVLGKVMGTFKQPTAAAVFDIRTKGKNVEVRLNSIVSPPPPPTVETKKDAKKETER